MSSSSSHATVTYTSHAPLSPDHTPEHAPLANDDLEPAKAQALPAPVLPTPLLPDYLAESEPIEDDPQEAKEDPEEELPALAAFILAIADLASRKSVHPQTPLPSSFDAHIEAWLTAPTPPLPSPLSSLSSPLPMIPSPPLPSSPTHRDTITEADLPPQKRARLSFSPYRFEIVESSAVAAARLPGSTLAQGNRDKLVVALEETNERVTDLDYETNRNSGNGNDNGNGSHDSGGGGGRMSHTARMYMYKEFLNCQPLNFKRTKGVTVGYDAAYGMTWKTLMKMMTEAYCPRSEIKKLETEMVPDETDKVERYVGGLPDNIQGSVEKGCHAFLAHITKKTTADKSKEKQLEDVPVVHDFSKVFPGVLPTRQKSSILKKKRSTSTPRVVYAPILDINYFRHFLVTLQNLNPMNDESMWAADRIFALTSGSVITISEIANEFAIKGDLEDRSVASIATSSSSSGTISKHLFSSVVSSSATLAYSCSANFCFFALSCSSSYPALLELPYA
nr:hypothetical protein [Tanacetum cinerariifolium]